jgi:hypothetical protein
MTPPEACSAASGTPSWVKMNFPTTAAAARTADAMPQAFKAIRLWDALDCLDVNFAKITAQSTGPTVVKNMVKTASAKAKLFGALILSALTDLDEPRLQRYRIPGTLCHRQPEHNLGTR